MSSSDSALVRVIAYGVTTLALVLLIGVLLDIKAPLYMSIIAAVPAILFLLAMLAEAGKA